MSILSMREFLQRGLLQYIVIGIAIVFAIGIVSLGTNIGKSDKEDNTATGVVAKINGQALDRVAYETNVQKQKDQMEQGNPPRMIGTLQETQFRGQIFDQMVEEMLGLQAAKREGVKVSGRDVNKKIEEIIDEQMKQIKASVLRGYKGDNPDKYFSSILARQEKGMTVEKLKTQIRTDIGKQKDAIKNMLMLEGLKDRIAKDIDVSDEAIKRSYDEFKLGQITVSAEKRSEAQAKVRAEEIAAKLKEGGDFAAAAKEYSDDPMGKTGGIPDMYIPKQYMDPDIAKAVADLKLGEISSPIKSRQGYVIAKLVDVKNALPKDFNDPKKKSELQKNYRMQEEYRVVGKYSENLRKTAKIDIKDPELKGYYLLKDLYEGQTSMSAANRKSLIEKAIKEYQRATVVGTDQGEVLGRAYAQIGFLYNLLSTPGLSESSKEEQSDYKVKAKEAFESALVSTESNDIRMFLVEMYIEDKEYDKAIESLEFASSNADYYDPNIHQQLLMALGKIKRVGVSTEKVSALIAEEERWMADYQRQMKEQASTQPAPTP